MIFPEDRRLATELFPFNTAGDVSLEKPPNNSLKGTVYPLSHLIPIPSYPFTSGICMVPCSRIFLVTVLSLAMITNANNLTTCKSLVIRQIVDSHGQSNISIPTKAERSSKCAQTSARREYVGKAAAQDIGLSERRILTGLLLLKSSRS